MIPVGADNTVFNLGIINEDIKSGTQSYQTSDIVFDESINAGQTYMIDLSWEEKYGRGVEKTKHLSGRIVGGL